MSKILRTSNMTIETHISNILNQTRATEIITESLIQPLWNNYGTLSRLHLEGSSDYPTVILKRIRLPAVNNHPRGFATDISRQRKIRSYQVEQAWYRHYNQAIESSECSTPKCLDIWVEDGETFILLEDLHNRGFSNRVHNAKWNQIVAMLQWLAAFHAQFLHSNCNELWSQGTYWHLSTRPDELTNIRGTLEHTFAAFMDAQIRSAQYQTIVHGDAKLANFLFTENGNRAAAVDFQYVGKGCGIQDVAYCLSSCLSELEWADLADECLEVYFANLRRHLVQSDIDIQALEMEWRTLYPVTCGDFQRFILGWSPQHYKNNTYTARLTHNVLNGIQSELQTVARNAALEAGIYIRSRWQTDVATASKGQGSKAADIVTEVDIEAQRIILNHLAPTIAKYDLGLLAEEGPQDDSRMHKHAFWTIDPMDGTLYFAEGRPGFAVSIALVTHAGEAILATVYDPVTEQLYETFKDCPVIVNGSPIVPPQHCKESPSLVLDAGFVNHPWYYELCQLFDIHFVGGAVMNAIELLNRSTSMYLKTPKHRIGGCAIWDLAAISLLLQNAGGTVCTYDGSPLSLNRSSSLYFNDVGFIFTGADLSLEEATSQLMGFAINEAVLNQ